MVWTDFTLPFNKPTARSACWKSSGNVDTFKHILLTVAESEITENTDIGTWFRTYVWALQWMFSFKFLVTSMVMKFQWSGTS